MKRLWILGGCLILTGLYAAGCGCANKPEWRDSLFSWSGDAMLPERESQLLKVMETLDCAAVYQEVPKDAQEDMVLDFLNRRARAEQEVYYLAGRPEWALGEDAKEMKEAVEKAAAWNEKAGEDQGFGGIVWDVEPYLLEEWDQDKSRIMEQFVSNCQRAYREAKKYGLKVLVCIPNFYDRPQTQEGLDKLIASGCDGVAVMNYNKSDEAGQIAQEVALAQKYKKGIVNIAELQMPGTHDLTENNTYYYDGIDGVKKSFEKLKKEFSYSGLAFSWHYLEPALELMERDGSS